MRRHRTTYPAMARPSKPDTLAQLAVGAAATMTLALVRP